MSLLILAKDYFYLHTQKILCLKYSVRKFTNQADIYCVDRWAHKGSTISLLPCLTRNFDSKNSLNKNKQLHSLIEPPISSNFNIVEINAKFLNLCKVIKSFNVR